MAEQKKRKRRRLDLDTSGEWKRIGAGWARAQSTPMEVSSDEGGFDSEGDEYYIEPCEAGRYGQDCDRGMRTYVMGEGEDDPHWTRDDDNRPYCPDHCYLADPHEYGNVGCEQCSRVTIWDHTANIPKIIDDEPELGWTASRAGEDEYWCPKCNLDRTAAARPSTYSRKEAATMAANRGHNLHRRKLSEIATTQLATADRAQLQQLSMPPPTQMPHLASIGETKRRKKRGGPGSPRGKTKRRRLYGGKKSRKKRRRRKTRRRRRKRSTRRKRRKRR